MRKIRAGCFEANSSSAHSIVVMKNGEHITSNDEFRLKSEHTWDYVFISRDGVYDVWDTRDGFWRSPFDVLSTFDDKLVYAMNEWFMGLTPSNPEWSKNIEMFENIIKETFPRVQAVHYINKTTYPIYTTEEGRELSRSEMIYSGDDSDGDEIYTYKDKNGNKHIAILSDEEYYEPAFGGIDHQSFGLVRSFLSDYGVTLREFLTNQKYRIVIDGDEYHKWKELKISGLINNGNIEFEYQI